MDKMKKANKNHIIVIDYGAAWKELRKLINAVVETNKMMGNTVNPGVSGVIKMLDNLEKKHSKIEKVQ